VNDRQLANSVLDAKLKALDQDAHRLAMERIADRLLKRGGVSRPSVPTDTLRNMPGAMPERG